MTFSVVFAVISNLFHFFKMQERPRWTACIPHRCDRRACEMRALHGERNNLCSVCRSDRSESRQNKWWTGEAGIEALNEVLPATKSQNNFGLSPFGRGQRNLRLLPRPALD